MELKLLEASGDRNRRRPARRSAVNQIGCDLCVHELTAMQLRERVKALEAALRDVLAVAAWEKLARMDADAGVAAVLEKARAALSGEERK
jgi:hypothetical protein